MGFISSSSVSGLLVLINSSSVIAFQCPIVPTTTKTRARPPFGLSMASTDYLSSLGGQPASMVPNPMEPALQPANGKASISGYLSSLTLNGHKGGTKQPPLMESPEPTVEDGGVSDFLSSLPMYRGILNSTRKRKEEEASTPVSSSASSSPSATKTATTTTAAAPIAAAAAVNVPLPPPASRAKKEEEESQSPPTPPSSLAIVPSTDPTKFSHASRAYFNVENLTPKGPRPNADVGEPHDSTRRLTTMGSTSAGSWWCAEGGWPSLTPRTTTEVFMVLGGHGCTTDLDGTQHYFGPGDIVVLPKGWSGRWDVLGDIHKVWCTHDHPTIINPSSDTIIHAHITPYSNLFTSGVQSSTIYKVGPIEVSSSRSSPGSFPVNDLAKTQFIHVLEGICFLTNKDGTAKRCVAGDTMMLPKGWSGYWDVLDTVRQLNVVVD